MDEYADAMSNATAASVFMTNDQQTSKGIYDMLYPDDVPEFNQSQPWRTMGRYLSPKRQKTTVRAETTTCATKLATRSKLPNENSILVDLGSRVNVIGINTEN